MNSCLDYFGLIIPEVLLWWRLSYWSWKLMCLSASMLNSVGFKSL